MQARPKCSSGHQGSLLQEVSPMHLPCRWFDCPQCHAELEDHNLKKMMELTFACKKCKKVFRKDINDFDEADEYCPQ